MKVIEQEMVTVIKIDAKGVRTYVRMRKSETKNARRISSASNKQANAVLG